ncbi:hypothetical protein NMY22_g17733 [Coprinellus aureogranulatus]|nr:hypothetical protein NMY22_g17733 [Coprinellus aureogranulatus]
MVAPSLPQLAFSSTELVSSSLLLFSALRQLLACFAIFDLTQLSTLDIFPRSYLLLSSSHSTPTPPDTSHLHLLIIMLFKASTYASLITLASLSTGVLAGGHGEDQGGNGWKSNGNNNWQPSPPPTSQKDWYPPPKNQPVQLHPNYNWKKCLDVVGGNFYNGAQVDIYDCTGAPGQNWLVNQGNTKVQLAGQNFCLDAGEWPNDGTQMKIWNCYDNLPAQAWYYTDDKRLALTGRGFCLDLTNGDTCNGNIMQIWSCTNWNANQIWST